MSSFQGLAMAKQALSAQQSALQTTEHNISNANTDGYSRQRVNFQTAPPQSASGVGASGTGQMGTGVETETVERIRSEFLDLQYRAENSKAGFWEERSESLSRLEDLMNEPSESGISETMEQFWESLEDLSVEPENSGAKSVVAQRAKAFTDAFNYTASLIESQRDELEDEIETDEKKVNSLVEQIDEMNEEIKQVEARGDLPNDLYDTRDNMLDELSEIVNIKVDYTKSGDSAKDIADGVATIELADEEGKSFDADGDGGKTVLLDGEDSEINELTVDKDSEAVSAITIGEGEQEQTFGAEAFVAKGSLMGNIESFGYEEGEDVKGTHPEMQQDLDEMVNVFTDRFNRIYAQDEENEQDFFMIDDDTNQASSVKVNEAILGDPDKITASSDDEEEYGDIASDLANLFDEPLDDDDLDDISINDYFESLVGNLGVKAEEANKMNDNAETLRSQADSKRRSVSEVSLDEEMTDMLKFQHAYNAAARSMTTLDETLDTVINNMGLVGR